MYGLAITTLDKFGAASTNIEYAENNRACRDRMVEIMEDATERGWEILNTDYYHAWLRDTTNGSTSFLAITPLRKIKA